MRVGNRGLGVFMIFLVTGAVLGGILGELIEQSSLLSGVAPYLVKKFPILHVPPATFDLYVLKFTAGFSLYPNLVSILGMILAVMLFKRY